MEQGRNAAGSRACALPVFRFSLDRPAVAPSYVINLAPSQWKARGPVLCLARPGEDPAGACTSTARPGKASESLADAGEGRAGLYGRRAGRQQGWYEAAEGAARAGGRRAARRRRPGDVWRWSGSGSGGGSGGGGLGFGFATVLVPAAAAAAQASPQDLASPGLSGSPAKPSHGAPGRAPPRLALPREPVSPAGDEAGKRLCGAQHKGLSPGAAAAAAATAPTSLEPPVEAEPAPGPSSPPVPRGGRCPSPRVPGTRAPSPLLPRLPGDRTAAQLPPHRAVGAQRSMSEDSDMEKAIKVSGRCNRSPSPLLCPVILLSVGLGKWRDFG